MAASPQEDRRSGLLSRDAEEQRVELDTEPGLSTRAGNVSVRGSRVTSRRLVLGVTVVLAAAAAAAAAVALAPSSRAEPDQAGRAAPAVIGMQEVSTAPWEAKVVDGCIDVKGKMYCKKSAEPCNMCQESSCPTGGAPSGSCPPLPAEPAACPPIPGCTTTPLPPNMICYTVTTTTTVSSTTTSSTTTTVTTTTATTTTITTTTTSTLTSSTTSSTSTTATTTSTTITTTSTTVCETATPDNPDTSECYHRIVWAKTTGIHEKPMNYPGLTASSSDHDFQQVLHAIYFPEVCQVPCPEVPTEPPTVTTTQPPPGVTTMATWTETVTTTMATWTETETTQTMTVTTQTMTTPPPVHTLPPTLGQCKIWGDPHLISFDGMHQDYYTPGEFWVVKSDEVQVQGRYMPLPVTNGLGCLTEIAVGGAFLQGNVLIVTATDTMWNGQSVATEFPSEFENDIVSIVYNSEGEALQEGRDGKELHALHVTLPNSVRMQITKWNEPAEGPYINFQITMPPVEGMDGHCGNFNGDPDDDDKTYIKERVGGSYGDVPAEEMILDGGKTEIKEVSTDINNCPQDTLTKAKHICKQIAKSEGRFFPAHSCLIDYCFGGGKEMVGEDADANYYAANQSAGGPARAG